MHRYNLSFVYFASKILVQKDERLSFLKQNMNKNLNDVNILLLQRYRDSPSATVTDRYGPFHTVTERYRILPLLALQALPALHYFFYKTLNICSKGPFRIGNACNTSNGKIW